MNFCLTLANFRQLIFCSKNWIMFYLISLQKKIIIIHTSAKSTITRISFKFNLISVRVIVFLLQTQQKCVDERYFSFKYSRSETDKKKNKIKNKKYHCRCEEVCRSPMELNCSKGHIFCEECIEKYWKMDNANDDEKHCPVDDETITVAQRSLFIQRCIDQLLVRCPNHQTKIKDKPTKEPTDIKIDDTLTKDNTVFCTWIGPLSEVQDHIINKCEFRGIACPFQILGCSVATMLSKDLPSHIIQFQCKHHSLVP
ncbi:hypothetical protein RFI_04218 [Reticulomyxa filosa]|uniref:RING-type domain-containing protein n=1 Tax=Reticulomyxa filosa TaxID=46433 RepID=X6P2Y8_RETFI|nr:hypothetical protein RFI_04218 [Reticulomyxa filosa]|eukprot:ETO32895.1 hypothetical protein RFI_04218 [Reticulomyxa filosa]